MLKLLGYNPIPSIPFANASGIAFFIMLYTAEERGINVIIQEESHTSRCSFLDDESIEHHDIYMGKRIRRGVFRSKNGILIHADLQAVYNIIKKAVPEAFYLTYECVEWQLHKILVVPLSHVHFLFPSIIMTYDNCINVPCFCILNNCPAEFMHQRDDKDDNFQRWMLTWLTEIVT